MSHHRGIQLPQALREDIAAKERDSSVHSKKYKSSLSRKDARKNERSEKKERKAQFFARSRPGAQQKRPAEQAHENAPPAKRQKRVDAPQAQPEPPRKQKLQPIPQQSSSDSNSRSRDTPKQKTTALERLQAKLDEPARARTRRSKDDEDDKIAYLEAKLGLDRKRSKGAYSSAFADDGLDHLLGDLDRIESGQIDGSGGEEDLNMEEVEADTSETDEEDDARSPEQRLDTGESEDEAMSDDEEEEWRGISFDDAKSASHSSTEDNRSINEKQTSASVDAPALSVVAPSGRYIPPALRKQQLVVNTPSEDAIKLSRHLKGLLNRMSEQNIASVLADFEEAYRKHSRHDVTSTLTTLIIDGIASHGAHLDAFVVVHAALVGALHRLVGVEFAAHFVQSTVERYDSSYAATKSSDSTEESSKQCSNMISLISELYALQIIACMLPYDIIRGLIEGPLDELDIELLLKLVRTSGPQMRTDDPSALKDIVQLVQVKVAMRDDMSSRTKYMIETLATIKSGKTKRGPDADGVGVRDVVDRMKKFLGGLAKKRQVMAHEPLRISLTDLRDAHKRGRWWLVGAAWSGDPLLERAAEAAKSENPAAANQEHESLVALARKHGMTTDVRRNIFVVLMSSEDCQDAANRLAALNLTDVQQREIVRVALHCLGAERSGYNPFWALVLQKTSSPAQKITMQFALWDFMRSMGESKVGGAEVVKNADEGVHGDDSTVSETRLENIARAYGWWIAKGVCAITVLKPLEFDLLFPQTRRFLKRMLTHLFISTQVASPVTQAAKVTVRKREAIERVFLLAARAPMLQQGLEQFLTSAFRKSQDGLEGDLVRWAVIVAKETLAAEIDLDAIEDEG